ncbi:ABC transporter substrate-binding protein [Streptomyces sp. LN245]|uniref:ABC transporter substrate-binding protein n=1 Tax=Streptomyces sp. LN245 TaxID=3112975 RepID=UPI003715472C
MSHEGVGLRAVMRSAAFLTAGVLAVPALSACSADDEADRPVAVQDIAPASRDLIADGGTLRWAVDAVPETLNAFQADADAATARVAGAVLPSMYRLDANGRPQINSDYLESAKVVGTSPKQVVLYKLNQQAVWSDGREIGAADFAAQWRALSGKDSAYWTARNAGYDRIEKIERGKNNLEVRVTFSRPYADWKALFSPLYPKDVMGTADSFNDAARRKLKVTAGPFALKTVDRKAGEVRLTRNARWWGRPSKLDEIDLVAVARDKRAEALADDRLDLAEIDPAEAERVTLAARHKDGAPLRGASATSEKDPSAEKSEKTEKSEKDTSRKKGEKSEPESESEEEDGKNAADEKSDKDETAKHEKSSKDDEESDKSDKDENGEKSEKSEKSAKHEKSDGSERDDESEKGEPGTKGSGARTASRSALSGFVVRKSLEPAYTQLALNGSEGPLADERVRRAVARALDRKELARVVLQPLGLPAEPVGSHLALAGQAAYADSSGALGNQDAAEARALLADAGWVPGGPVTEQKKTEKAAGSKGKKGDGGEDGRPGKGGTYVLGDDDKPSGVGREPCPGPQGPREEAGAADRRAAVRRAGRPSGGVRAQGDGRSGGRRVQRPRQGRQTARAALRRSLRHGLGVPAPRGRPDRADAPARRCPYGHHEGLRRQLLQGPHRLGRLRPGALLVARLRLPGHRRPPDLRQARSGGGRLAERRAELHPRRHRPGRSALRQGTLHPGRGRGTLPGPQGGRPYLGRRRLHPPLPAPPARRRPRRPGEHRSLRLPDSGVRGHGLPEEGREGTWADADGERDRQVACLPVSSDHHWIRGHGGRS